MSYTDDQDPHNKPQALKLVGAGVFLLAVVGLIWGVMYMSSAKQTPKPEKVAEVQPTPPPEPIIESDEQEPVPQPVAEPPPVEPESPPKEPAPPAVKLPPLNDSDSEIRKTLSTLTPGQALVDLLVPQEIVRKFVLAINNVSKGELARKYPPISPPNTKFIARKLDKDKYIMSLNSYKRYDAYADIVSSLNPDVVATLYRQYYPLLEEAHRELGETKESFHSVLLKAVDHILEAPIKEGELNLIRPSVMYKFADPKLEKLSDPHKLMLRTGPQNTRKIQHALRELRKSLAS